MGHYVLMISLDLMKSLEVRKAGDRSNSYLIPLKSHILQCSTCWEKILITEKQIHCQVHFKMKIANWILFVKGFCRHQRCNYESVLSTTSIFKMAFLWDYLPILFKIHKTLK